MQKGEPPPKGVKELVIKLAGMNPRPTNGEIRKSIQMKFGGQVTVSERTIVRYCKEAGLPTSSRRTVAGNDVKVAIKSAEIEKLVIKNNDNTERAFPLSCVLLAIADRLAVGMGLEDFEPRILQGLSLPEGWFIPYDKIPHIVGVFSRNALIDRHNEEYQQFVLDYPYAAVLNPGAKHLEKVSQVKYYLSSLGCKVVQQLRRGTTTKPEWEKRFKANGMSV